jgi:TPR repeat protein
MSPLYRRFTRIIGSPILWLPTRAFINDEAKWELVYFARQFLPESTVGDTSFFPASHRDTCVDDFSCHCIVRHSVLYSDMQESQLRRGLTYLAGDRDTRNDARGVELITATATNGFAPAQNELGLLYMSDGMFAIGAMAAYLELNGL